MTKIPFQTTPEQIATIPDISKAMIESLLPSAWVDKVAELAKTDQGVYDLMELWTKTDDYKERFKIEYALYDSLRDYARLSKNP